MSVSALDYAQGSGGRFKIVMTLSVVLSLPAADEFLTGQIDLTGILERYLLALVLAWVGVTAVSMVLSGYVRTKPPASPETRELGTVGGQGPQTTGTGASGAGVPAPGVAGPGAATPAPGIASPGSPRAVAKEAGSQPPDAGAAGPGAATPASPGIGGPGAGVAPGGIAALEIAAPGNTAPGNAGSGSSALGATERGIDTTSR